jgi:hypothetical protein
METISCFFFSEMGESVGAGFLKNPLTAPSEQMSDSTVLGVQSASLNYDTCNLELY